MNKIYISDCDHPNIEQEQQIFEQAGISYRWLKCKTQQDVIEQCQGVEALLNQYIVMDKNIFRNIPSLKCIVRYGVGYDNINVSDATQFGVQICNVPDYGVNEVADHALALMMCLVRKIDKISRLTRSGIWDYQHSIPIHRGSRSTVGIIGVGRIGSAFAKRVKAMGYKVLGYDIEYSSTNERFPKDVEFVTYDRLLEESDIISIHCSLNEQSYNMIDKNAFDKMKEGSYLLNVARGGIVNEPALFAAITSGKLAGAGIDVVESEPLKLGNELLINEHVIVTPHMAWYSEESAKELKRKCAEEALRYVQRIPVWYPINNAQEKLLKGKLNESNHI